MTRSNWLNCALRGDEAVYSWWHWISIGLVCLYILKKLWKTRRCASRKAWMTDSLTTWNQEMLAHLKSGYICGRVTPIPIRLTCRQAKLEAIRGLEGAKTVKITWRLCLLSIDNSSSLPLMMTMSLTKMMAIKTSTMTMTLPMTMTATTRMTVTDKQVKPLRRNLVAGQPSSSTAAEMSSQIHGGNIGNMKYQNVPILGPRIRKQLGLFLSILCCTLFPEMLCPPVQIPRA